MPLSTKNPQILPTKALAAAIRCGAGSSLLSRGALLLALSILLTDVSFANVVGADTQNFNPTTSGLDFVTVQSAQTLDPGIINFGFFLNEAANSLPYYDANTQSRAHISDSLLSADINVGIGLLPGLDIGVSAPQVVSQNAAGNGYHGQFAQTGNTEVRFNTKWQALGGPVSGLALVGTASLNRIKSNPFLGDSPGPTYDLELATDTHMYGFALAANVGYRWRHPGSSVADAAPILPFGDAYIASGALSYLFSSIDTKLIFEVFGSVPVKSEGEYSDRVATTSEALLGVKHDFTTNLAGHVGAGTELQDGRGSPDWRLYAGINYAIGPTFSKTQPTKVDLAQPTILIKADPFAGPPKAKEKIVIHDILFEFDSDSLVVGGADDTLKRLVQYLNTKPVFSHLIIEGHTDSIGSEDYNNDLSRRRANTIRKWLIEKFHLPAAKIEAVGRGKRFPIADNGNYQGRQLNRRVEFTIFRETNKH